MRDQELRDQIAALFRCAPGERRLGDEPPGPIADAVLEVVGPLLAEKDAEARSLAKSWDQRLSDVQAEYAKHLESWDRTWQRLSGERALLLWLHAEAAWRLHAERNDRQRHVISLLNDTEHAEKENDGLRREVKRLRREVQFEALGLPPYDRRTPHFPVCACVSDEQAEVIRAGGFSRPVCAVHPEGGPLGCTCPSPLVSSASDCPSHGHAAMQGEFVSGWDFRCDTCRSRDHRHPQSGCHLVGCPCAVRSSPSVHPGEKP